MPSTLLDLFITSFGETLLMVGASGLAGAILGALLGLGLYVTRQQPSSRPFIGRFFDLATRGVQSTPSIVLLAALIPLGHFFWGESIGMAATIPPLAIIATSYVARHVNATLHAVDQHMVEAALTMGASWRHIVCQILVPEASPDIVSSLGIMLASLVGYSALAGALGGGGLGSLGIHYGYREFLPGIMLAVVLMLVALAETFHVLGRALAQRLDRR